MLYISYQGIFNGTNFEYANTAKQITKSFSMGFQCMVDVWRVDNKLYLGTEQPTVEVSEQYLRGSKFWINIKNDNLESWISTQPAGYYPNYFKFQTSTPPPDYTIASNGKYIVPGTVPLNNQSVIFLPEIQDRALFSTVKLKCYGVISSYLSFIKRMRNEGIWY